VIEEPVQPVKRNLAVDLFVDRQRPLDRLVVGRVQAERPAVFHEMPDDGLQLTLHDGEQVRTWNQEVFEVRRRKDQHFAGPIDAIEIIAVSGPGQCRPAAEVGQLPFRSSA